MNDPTPDERSLLEARFDHVVRRLIDCWGDPEYFALVFDDLMYDRRGDRSGWPFDVFEELQFLRRLHEAAYGVSPTRTDVWDEKVPDD